MRLFHRTTKDKATSILRSGFRDASGNFMTGQQFSGVWLSEVPLDANDGAWGDTLLEVSLDCGEADLDQYEWKEDGKPQREWLVPASLIRERGTVRIAEGRE